MLLFLSLPVYLYLPLIILFILYSHALMPSHV